MLLAPCHHLRLSLTVSAKKINMADNKRQNMTAEQKTLLVQFVTKNPKLRHGKFTADFTYKNSQQLWEECATICNSIPGANKDWKGWRKTWQTMKSITKSKKAAINRERGSTGGGPYKNIVLQSVDEDIERLISATEALGDEAVEESAADFVFAESTETRIINSFVNGDGNEDSYSMDYVDDFEAEVPPATQSIPQQKGNITTDSHTGSTAEPSTSSRIQSSGSSIRKEKAVPSERRKKLSVPAQRLKKSISEAKKLVDVSWKVHDLRKTYFEKKLEMFERIAVSMERMASAMEKFTAVPEEAYPAEYLDGEV